jgi:hypothetical protein
MEKTDLETTLYTLEQEVIDDLNLEFPFCLIFGSVFQTAGYGIGLRAKKQSK